MFIKYFKGTTWERISREERFFCSFLFNDIRKKDNLDRFIRFLNAAPSTTVGFKNDINLNPETYWEIGYEVCFYRDMIYKFKNKTIGEINQRRKRHGKDELPHKRTFDLCLFSDDDIVIIEAKVQQGLESKQCDEFKKDRKFLTELFEEIDLKCPNISFIVLVSSNYLSSSSFTHPNGIGKRLIYDDDLIVNGFITWEQINAIFSNQIYVDADSKYKN